MKRLLKSRQDFLVDVDGALDLLGLDSSQITSLARAFKGAEECCCHGGGCYFVAVSCHFRFSASVVAPPV
jgi:hypothetical protein